MNPFEIPSSESTPVAPPVWTWNPVLSRRSVLKAAGIATLATMAGVTTMQAAASDTTVAGLATPLNAGATALLGRALDALRLAGFAFDPNQASVLERAGAPGVWALLLQDTRVGPHPAGADLALTIDQRAPGHAMVHYVIGQAQPAGLEIQSVVVSERGRPSVERRLLARGATAACAAVAPSDATAYCAVKRMGAQAAEGTPWYYDYCCATAWQETAGGRHQLRFTQAAEYRNVRAAEGWLGETRSVAIPA